MMVPSLGSEDRWGFYRALTKKATKISDGPKAENIFIISTFFLHERLTAIVLPRDLQPNA
jgi:hypothetical protein